MLRLRGIGIAHDCEAVRIDDYAQVAAQNGNAPGWDMTVDVGHQAEATVTAWRNRKKAQEKVQGVDAGNDWFRSLNGVNNPVPGGYIPARRKDIHVAGRNNSRDFSQYIPSHI